MTTEANPSEPVAPTPNSEAAPPAPPSESQESSSDDDAGIFAKAMEEAARSMGAEPPKPAEPKAPEPPKPPAEAKPEQEAKPEGEAKEGGEEKLPTWDELQAEIAQRNQQKQQAQGQQPPQPEEERTQAQQQAAERKADAVAASMSIEEFKRDPVGVAAQHGLNPRDMLRAFAGAAFGQKQQQGDKQKSAVDPAEIQRLIDERVEKQWQQFQKQRDEQEAEQRKAAQRQSAEIAFTELTTDSEQFPRLSRLGDDERVWYGYRFANAFLEAGRTPSDTQIAQAIEQHLAERFSPAASTGSADKNQSATGDDENPKGQSGPATLSQSLPAQPSTVIEPKTDEDYVEMARRVAAAEMAGG